MNETEKNEDENPPILGTWSNMYMTVLIIYVLMIISLFFFTQAFS